MILNPFVVVEGLDGTGKTTICAALTKVLQQEGYQVIDQAEPSRGMTGQKLRKLLATLQQGEGHARRLTPLFAQDRREHLDLVTHVLNSAHFSRRDTIVLFDRYIASSLAYQWDKPNDRDIFDYTLSHNMHFPRPDITFYLTAPLSVIKERLGARNRDGQRDFTESEIRLTETRLRYIWAKEALASTKHRWFEIDTNRPVDTITQEMKGILLQWLRSL